MRNRDSRAHYFANSRNEKRREPLRDFLRGNDALSSLGRNQTSSNSGNTNVIAKVRHPKEGRFVFKNMRWVKFNKALQSGVPPMNQIKPKTEEVSVHALQMPVGGRQKGAKPGGRPCLMARGFPLNRQPIRGSMDHDVATLPCRGSPAFISGCNLYCNVRWE